MWVDLDIEKAVLINAGSGCMGSISLPCEFKGSWLSLWRVERSCYTTVCILNRDYM